MATRARLDWLEIRNYLGAGDEPVTLEFNGKHAVLCGPNGSGKTTVLSALDRVRRINWIAVLQTYSIGHGPSEVSVWEWVDGRPQNVAVLALGGSDAASDNFDPEQWQSLHSRIGAILDSERKSAEEGPQKERQEIKAKLDAVGIHCHLTAWRSTENYFTERALRSVYGDCVGNLDPFGDPNLANQGIKQFTKSRNGEVAQAMDWAEIETTDLGKRIEDFLKS